MICWYGIDIVWVSGGGFCRFLVLVEELQVTELHLASRDKIGFISYHTSLRRPAVQRFNKHILFKPVLEFPLDLRGGQIKPWGLNDYTYTVICLIWGAAGSWKFARGGVGCCTTYVQPRHRLPETCLPWQHALSAALLEDHQPSCMPGGSLVTHCKHSGEKYWWAVGHVLLHPSYSGGKSTWRCSREKGFLGGFIPRLNYLKLLLGTQQQVGILHAILI